MIVLSLFCLVLGIIPAVLFLGNVRLYALPPRPGSEEVPRVSVLIPARNEEGNIRDAVKSALANLGVEMEVIVADDASHDGTAAIVRELAAQDTRVQVITIPALTSGWNGKQHACHVLAEAAHMPLLCFVDADVRLAPDALASMAAFLGHSQASLVSGIPRQVTASWMEALLIPLIHFVLLAFLPIARMRTTTDPRYAAGCGQLFMAVNRDYHVVGGHSVIRNTLHDGIKLAAAFRRAGFKTDLFDATSVARCRMYHNAAEVWSGLMKNATEGMATPVRLPVFTALLLGGQVLPFALLFWAAAAKNAAMLVVAGGAVSLSYGIRLIAARRFRQPFWSTVLHPLGVALLLLIQWLALGRMLLGKTSSWKDREYGLQST